MKFSGRMVLAVGLLVAGLGGSLAMAASVDEAIQGRQACMKDHGKAMGAMFTMFKGEKPYDSAAVQDALKLMNSQCGDWDKWWGPETQKGDKAETWAKPEIWSDNAGFQAAGKTFYEKFLALQATTDEASFKKALPELGEACKGCHEKFRRPKDQ